MIYALIKDGVVVNTIVAEESFIPTIENDYDHCVRVDLMNPQPGRGFLYDGNTFTDPDPMPEPEI